MLYVVEVERLQIARVEQTTCVVAVKMSVFVLDDAGAFCAKT
jgi:hypothetical protein